MGCVYVILKGKIKQLYLVRKLDSYIWEEVVTKQIYSFY